MLLLKRTLIFLLFVDILLLGFWIAQENSTPVVIKLLGFPIQEISPGVNLLGMFFCGALLGLLASTPSKVRATRKNHQMGRTLSSSNRQILDLKS